MKHVSFTFTLKNSCLWKDKKEAKQNRNEVALSPAKYQTKNKFIVQYQKSKQRYAKVFNNSNYFFNPKQNAS